MLGIVSREHIESKKALLSTRSDQSFEQRKKTKGKKFKKSVSSDPSKLSKRNVIDLYDGKVLMTSIQYDTLNPTWNESFQL